MRIEAIKPSQRKKGRILVKLSDGSILRLTEDVVLVHGLRPGEELSEERLVSLRSDAAAAAVKAQAAELVGRRALSRRELEQKLRQKGAEEAAAHDAAEWLEDIGALDDGSYAAVVARHYAQMGYGPGRVRQELQRRGIGREHWEAALQELPDSAGAIAAYIEKRCRGAVPDERERRRIADGLLRRGFRWEEIRPALERLCGQEDAEA